MFRRLMIISTIAIALAGTAALAQGVRPRTPKRNALAGQGLERMRQRLNLTDAQMNGIRALQENRRGETSALRQEMRQKRQALRQLMQAPNPNPNDVGNATLALKESRERMRDIHQRFAAGIKGLLTPEQARQLPKRLR